VADRVHDRRSVPIFFGWFIIFEIWWSGRTPGKRALGLARGTGVAFRSTPARRSSATSSASSSSASVSTPASAVCALLSRENKRLGDFAAGTIVVRDRAETAPDLDAYLARPVRSDTGLSAGDRQLIERFLARRAALDPAARIRLAAPESPARVRPTLRADYGHLGDETLLEFLVDR